MIEKVLKRDGTEVQFDGNKIINAIMKANAEVEESERLQMSDAVQIATEIKEFDWESDVLSVETIQDNVERGLMSFGFYDVAKAYITYRYRRAMVRQSNTTDESILTLVRNENKEMDEENSNKNPKMASTQRD